MGAYWNEVSSLMFRIILFVLEGQVFYMNANSTYNSGDLKHNTNFYAPFMVF